MFQTFPMLHQRNSTVSASRIGRSTGSILIRKSLYGEWYLPDEEALMNLSGKKVVYIGWSILPPLQNLKILLRNLGLQTVESRLDPHRFMNHITQSWLWQNPAFPMRELARHGQYQVYEVRKLSPIAVQRQGVHWRNR